MNDIHSNEIGNKLVEFCKKGDFNQAVENLYDQNIQSIEAFSSEDMPAETTGLENIKKKNQWWVENHEVHSMNVEGPFPNGNQFAVNFEMDITFKPSGERKKMKEVALYTVENDKIVKEQFFYSGE